MLLWLPVSPLCLTAYTPLSMVAKEDPKENAKWYFAKTYVLKPFLMGAMTGARCPGLMVLKSVVPFTSVTSVHWLRDSLAPSHPCRSSGDNDYPVYLQTS